MRFLDYVKYYLATLPEVLADNIIPVAFLLALLYALTTHSRHNELVAIRAAGISVWRLSVPYLSVGAVLGAVVLVLNETAAPNGAERARQILQAHKASGGDSESTGAVHFRSDDGARDWVIDGGMNKETGELARPQIRWIRQQPGMPERVHAASAVFQDGQWVFSNADIWPWGIDQSTVATNYHLALPETPSWIRLEIRFAGINRREAAKRPQLAIAELLTYLRMHPHLSPGLRAMYLTQLQGRIAAPFTCVAVVLIAFPLGARSGRRNVAVGVAAGIFICFGYFVAQRIFFGLGTGGIIPPTLAAWLPNAIFGAIGLFLMSRL